MLKWFQHQKCCRHRCNKALDRTLRNETVRLRGYILKGVGSRALAAILRNVAAGERYLAPTLSARMLSDLKSPQPADGVADRLRQLTERQTEILRLVGEGLTNKEVALRLDLHEKTVKHHMTGVLTKLNVRNRTEAALVVRELRDTL